MNFKKLFAATAFAAAVTTAFAVSAFAETDPLTATYNKEAGTITIANAEELNPATLLVLNTAEGSTAAEPIALTTIANTDIKQIDEVDEAHTYTSAVVGELADGVYELRIGGEGTVYNAFFTVGGQEEEKVLVGNTDGDELGKITSNDATMVLLYTVFDDQLDEKQEYAAAYCDGDNKITSNDATMILLNTVFDYENDGQVGNEVAIGKFGVIGK